MAGYHGYSKSNNAIQAEREGLYPLTQAKKVLKELKPELTLNQAEALLKDYGPSEWHHTSSYYNMTDYYNPEAVVEELEEGGLTIPQKTKSQKPEVKTFRASVKWLEWSGTRKYRKAKEREDTATVTVKGQTATCVTDNHGKITKRLSTRGFDYTILQ